MDRSRKWRANLLLYCTVMTVPMFGCGDAAGPFESSEDLNLLLSRLEESGVVDVSSLGLGTVWADYLEGALLELEAPGVLLFDFGSEGLRALSTVALVFPTDLDMVDFRIQGSVAAVLAWDPNDLNGTVLSVGAYGWPTTDVLPRRTTILSALDPGLNGLSPNMEDLGDGSGWAYLRIGNDPRLLQPGFGGSVIFEEPDVGGTAPCAHSANRVTRCVVQTGLIEVDLNFRLGNCRACGGDGQIDTDDGFRLPVSAVGVIPVVVMHLSGVGGEVDPATPVSEIEMTTLTFLDEDRTLVRIPGVNSSAGVNWVLRTAEGVRVLGVNPTVRIENQDVAAPVWETIGNVNRLRFEGLQPGSTTATLEANGATKTLQLFVGN